MPAIGLTVFVRFPGESTRRILCPATVIQTSGEDGLTILPEDAGLTYEVGQELLIYFEQRRQFVQQPATIEALLESESGNVVVLRTTGEPVSAESRQCYRVSTILSNLSVTFDGVEGCPLRDVSVTGFAVISPNVYQVGQVLDTQLVFDGEKYAGRGRIQSVSPMRDGKMRYGVKCVKAPATPHSLAKGVQLITMAVQRQQLKRLAGGA